MGDGHDSPNVDITTITDITVLKAMAYDQISALEQAQQNIRVINERINQVSIASNGAFAATMEGSTE